MSTDLFNTRPIEPGPPVQQGRIAGLNGGLNSMASPKDMPLIQSPDMESIRVDDFGIRKDYRLSALADTGNTDSILFMNTNLAEFSGSSPGILEEAVRLLDSGVLQLSQYSSGSWGNWTDGASFSIPTFVDTDHYYMGRIILGYYFICFVQGDGSLAPLYDADFNNNLSSFTELTTPTSLGYDARDVIYFAERAVFLGGPDSNDTVYFSVNGNPTDLSGTGSGTVNLTSGFNLPLDPNCGLGLLGNNLIIFRYNSIVRGVRTGSAANPIAFFPWIQGVGTSSQHSIEQGESGVFFLGTNRMLYYLTEGQGLRTIGKNIINRLQYDLRDTNLQKVICSYDNNSQFLYMAYPSQANTTCDTLLILDFGHFLRTGEERWMQRSETVEYMTFVQTVPEL